MERMREPVRVAAVFTPGRAIRPVWFDWNREKHTVLETTYSWREKSGETILIHFAVADGQALYELVYDTHNQSWMLHGVEVG
ncbi:MAG TPA: hypothetical protein PLI53_03265 [Geobacteraceae bacterium]|nr:hypothetical protein [Geobacteraceae bacterium]